MIKSKPTYIILNLYYLILLSNIIFNKYKLKSAIIFYKALFIYIKNLS